MTAVERAARLGYCPDYLAMFERLAGPFASAEAKAYRRRRAHVAVCHICWQVEEQVKGRHEPTS
jgi:hypothetical protein